LVENREFRGQRISFRIGINSGPVLAGIIGRRKFSYDLWGDSVNTASRMEFFGSPGHIQITESTQRLIEDEFRCESRGSIEVKDKGSMPVWFLTGRR
jgi:guanylate cyclase